ncbi:MAG: hypothetical protein A2283_21290 [Lentisphaerae bacterium RIFOXYA12_FULL_48_11]|nr:MAG: hypothetical protein A2283_21290 [Lentisphaerae bacterium RIFOXYA12_FULL_48_11]
MWKPTYAFYFPAEQFALDGFGCKASEVRGILMVSEDFSNTADEYISRKFIQLKMRKAIPNTNHPTGNS